MRQMVQQYSSHNSKNGKRGIRLKLFLFSEKFLLGRTVPFVVPPEQPFFSYKWKALKSCCQTFPVQQYPIAEDEPSVLLLNACLLNSEDDVSVESKVDSRYVHTVLMYFPTNIWLQLHCKNCNNFIVLF